MSRSQPNPNLLKLKENKMSKHNENNGVELVEVSDIVALENRAEVETCVHLFESMDVDGNCLDCGAYPSTSDVRVRLALMDVLSARMLIGRVRRARTESARKDALASLDTWLGLAVDALEKATKG